MRVTNSRDTDFAAFVAGSAGGLLRTAYVLTGDRHAAEDLLQDVLERVYVGWHRVDDPVAYSRRALVNASANRWRRHSRKPEVPLLDWHAPAVGDHAPQADARDEVVRALAQLPPRQRAVVVLRFLEDLSETETAAVLGCRPGTVKSQASKALSRLRVTLPDPFATTQQGAQRDD